MNSVIFESVHLSLTAIADIRGSGVIQAESAIKTGDSDQYSRLEGGGRGGERRTAGGRKIS